MYVTAPSVFIDREVNKIERPHFIVYTYLKGHTAVYHNMIYFYHEEQVHTDT